MHHETGTFRSPDGLELFRRRWTPDRETRATVVLIHGVHEHSGRYAYVASALMREGIEVEALDLRGHGQSPGERAQVEAFTDYTRDAAAFVDAVLAEAEGRPVFLMGHSMGGLVVSGTVVDRGTRGLAGVLLSSPALQLYAPPLLERLAPVLAKWVPSMPAGKLDLSTISRDPTIVRAYREDPLTTKKAVRAHLGYEFLKTIAHVRAHPEAFDVPLYLFHGTGDKITDPAGTRWLAEHAASEDVTLKLYDGLYHETLNEPERDEVIGDLAAWLVARIEAG